MAMPNLFKKKPVENKEMEIITGQEIIPSGQFTGLPYQPEEINEDEIEDVGDQLADRILWFMQENGTNPIPGDQPVNFMRAAELTNIAVTQQHVGFLLMKQEECDKLENIPWFVKYLPLLLLVGLSFCLPVLLMLIGQYALGMLHK